MQDAAGGDFEPDMPDAGAAAYLLGHLWAAGPTQGEHALTFAEMRNYEEAMGIRLSPWEFSTLRRLSGAYLGESHKAREADCPPPFADSADAQRMRRAQVKAKLRKFLS